MKTPINKGNMLLVANPKSGICKVKDILLDLLTIFTKAGYTVTVYPTRKSGTTEYLKEHAKNYSVVVCCGGDGTLSEVLRGVCESKSGTPVGYIPMGSTNDFAKSLGISKNPKSAAMSIINGTVMPYDLGSINGRYFSYIAAVGAFTGASYSAPQRLKNSLGHFAYLLEGAKYLTKIKPFEMKVSFNGKKFKDEFIYASVSNTTSVAGLVKLNRDEVCFDDGTFELVLVRKPRNLKEAAELITALLSNKLECSCIKLFHTSEVNMQFDKDPCFTIDGEKLEAQKEVTVKNHTRAVNLVVPKRRFI